MTQRRASVAVIGGAVIGGDGIGPEVLAEATKVLLAAAGDAAIETASYDLGSQRWHRTGEILPDSVLAELAAHDAILLGARESLAFSPPCSPVLSPPGRAAAPTAT